MHNSEVADPQEVPKNRRKLWALIARSMGNECPSHGLSMPDAWSLSARLMVSGRPPYVLLVLIQVINLFFYS